MAGSAIHWDEVWIFRGALLSIDLSQFNKLFFEEASEHLAEMETLLLALDVAEPSRDDLNAIFRAAHSIKGGAGTFGFNDMIDVTHILETLLDKLRKQEMKLTVEMVNTFLEAGDVIGMQLAAHRGEAAGNTDAVLAVCEKLAQLAGNSPESAQAKAQEDSGFGFFMETPVEEANREAVQGFGFFQDLPDLAPPVAAGERKDDHPTIQENNGNAPRQGRRAIDAVDADGVRTGKRATDKVVAAQTEATSIRVGVEKVDQLINLMGEMVITQSILAQAAQGENAVENENLHRSLHQLERNTRDLQEAVMSIRMMPIAFVFSRFPRLVRDLASKLNKQVEIKLVGESTELDKGLIEKISDPLTHLVRNSLDHGIELPEKRVAAGKSPSGTITLKAFHQGGNVVIEVSDDGGGLNRGRILQKARERNLPLHEDMTEQDIWALIMEPGFSTAEVVTDVSGRGVGMDVVRRNIASLGGRVELDSVEGMGTRVNIRLPLTLAILDGLSVSVGQQTYIIPLNAILESLPGSSADLKTVSGGHVLRVRGQYLPIIELHKIFNIETRVAAPSQGILVLLEADGKKIALSVDELIGQHQVVLKSMESNYRKVPCISGATIMGDGQVALILDVAALVRINQEVQGRTQNMVVPEMVGG